MGFVGLAVDANQQRDSLVDGIFSFAMRVAGVSKQMFAPLDAFVAALRFDIHVDSMDGC